ncbi:hypothetical protein FNO01nite_09300 [Flavobacterium noncentrifugens]|uniref:DUF393 domain-containing protein n=1 Tax=Flavobacterium noncentrifugens TaxID=1128970 RepID=A0A1G8UXL7_9FLAO|nr:hypothetical protein [Flavobacterium noncentrifugens]GEP50258.1 hypothetical protein FNO01nite_09300 [Flavobacterium noncentrifugens]SDJ58561.1 hypothetical protein SAMN04487935_1093 [Flavobacterium noncentrifugens]
MKTLENQTLLYDDDCPLCQVYTAGFINTGMLDANGRKPFAKLTEIEYGFVDIKRAANEIALVDRKNNTVIYGIDSLLKIIGNSFPWIEKLGHLKVFNYFLRKLYSFVSYNRKVIIPNKTDEKTLQCIPDFSYKYRLLYVIFAANFTAIILFYYSEMIGVLPKGNFIREWVLAFGQILFQIAFLVRHSRKTVLNYVGHLLTVSLLGSLLLLAIILCNQLESLPQFVILGWFGCCILLMFAEHYRRIQLLKLPFYLCYTWILYSVIAILFILTF